MYEDTILPYAISLGIKYFDFWKMNPRILKAYVKAQEKKMDEIDQLMWTMGLYVRSAVGTAVEHVLAGRKAQSTYVERPFRYDGEDENENHNDESKEQVAVFEMNQRINLLRQQGLPESPM